MAARGHSPCNLWRSLLTPHPSEKEVERAAGACVRSVQTVVCFFSQHFLRAGASPRKEGRVPSPSRLPLLTSWRINEGHGITSAQLAPGRESGARPPNIHSWFPHYPLGNVRGASTVSAKSGASWGFHGAARQGKGMPSLRPSREYPCPRATHGNGRGAHRR